MSSRISASLKYYRPKDEEGGNEKKSFIAKHHYVEFQSHTVTYEAETEIFLNFWTEILVDTILNSQFISKYS